MKKMSVIYIATRRRAGDSEPLGIQQHDAAGSRNTFGIRAFDSLQSLDRIEKSNDKNIVSSLWQVLIEFLPPGHE